MSKFLPNLRSLSMRFLLATAVLSVLVFSLISVVAVRVMANRPYEIIFLDVGIVSKSNLNPEEYTVNLVYAQRDRTSWNLHVIGKIGRNVPRGIFGLSISNSFHEMGITEDGAICIASDFAMRISSGVPLEIIRPAPDHKPEGVLEIVDLRYSWFNSDLKYRGWETYFADTSILDHIPRIQKDLGVILKDLERQELSIREHLDPWGNQYVLILEDGYILIYSTGPTGQNRIGLRFLRLSNQ